MSRHTLTLRGASEPPAPALSTPTPVPTPKPVPPASDGSRERFWFVWAPTEQRPKRRHPTFESARAEAARLAALAPHKEFLVYEATRLADESSESKG